METTPQELGVEAEKYVAGVLRAKGYAVSSVSKYKAPFDLFCNGKRIEVKVARVNASLKWSVNIHRHGKLNEGSVDAYIFLLDFRHLDKKKPLVLLRKAPIECCTLTYSLDSLLTIHHKDIENWSVLEN